MSEGFTRLSQDGLNRALAEVLHPRIEAIIGERGPGHCMRMTDLDDAVMDALCEALRQDRADRNVFILSGHEDEGRPYRISSTKLVELRNPDAEGGLREPLLVFLPASLRTSAEDSFGVATFEELSFAGLYADLLGALLDRLPSTLVGHVRQLFGLLSDEDWPFASDVARVRYLLTALENGIDGETLGASLYELTLIPDFKLFADPGMLIARARRNLGSVRNLMSSHKSVRGRIADLGLSDKALAQRLFAYFEQHEIQEPEVWTRPIATDKPWWGLSFDKWTFQEELSLDKVSLRVLETDLPLVREEDGSEQLSGLVGQQVLIPNDRRKMAVVFEVNPHPGKVSGLDHFSVQIVAQNGGPVGKSKKVKAWTPRRVQCTTTLTKLNKIDFEEGWHVIRVLPWTADGDPIPLDMDQDAETDACAYESEPFYVLPGGALEEEPPQRAIPVELSLEHARIRLQLTAVSDERDPEDIALTGVEWADAGRSRKNARQETLLVKFGRDRAVQVPMSRVLKTIEQRILAAPRHPAGWRMQINLDAAEPPTEAGLSLPSSTAMSSFLAAREDFFALIRGGAAELVMQGLSFLETGPMCLSYAEAYLDLVRSLSRQAEATSGSEQQQHLVSLRTLLAVDTVHVILTDFRGRHREAVLVSPTHPLRALWLASWSELARDWIGRVKTGGQDHIGHVRSALLERLAPAAFPVGVPVEDGRIFTPVEQLNPFWALYAATTETSARGLVAEICSALGLSEPSVAGADLSGRVIAGKIERYLSQHPYVRELSINVFNPGTGALIAEALLALQQKREHADLRYDIRLFAPDPDSPVVGESLELMVRPGTTIDEAGDAFARSTGSHLFSKLNLAKHALEAFEASPKDYPAHISLLMDVFSAEELSIAERPSGITPLHGLIQDFDTDFVDDEAGAYWSKWPVVGAPLGADQQAACFDTLAALSRQLCSSISAVAASGASFKAVPTLTLGLGVAERALIYDVHQTSDWVFTIDRNMGIEFFDHGGRKNRPDYLIDYVPGASSQATHNLIISSRSNVELEAMLKPTLSRYELAANAEQSARLLASLNALSGQLALKLISAPTQQLEALGLAFARLYLEYQGALSNQVIVPLDAHIDLYRTSGEIDDVNDALSLQRTDLALFDLDLSQRIMTCNLVEVKCYSQVGDFAAFNQLKERISAQVNQSERILQRHFDPSLKQPERPDRLLKSRELAQILRFYLERAVRHGIFGEEAAQEARGFLASIESGSSLQFRRCALIFDFDKPGTEAPEVEVGIEFHRVGKDLIHALVENCCAPVVDNAESETTTFMLSEQFIPSVPRLETAAFLAPVRERSVTRLTDTAWTEDASDLDSLAADTSEEPDEPREPDSVAPKGDHFNDVTDQGSGQGKQPSEPADPIVSPPVQARLHEENPIDDGAGTSASRTGSEEPRPEPSPSRSSLADDVGEHGQAAEASAEYDISRFGVQKSCSC